MSNNIHPFINNGLKKTPSPNTTGGTLTCHCATNKVRVKLGSNVLHNHFCGCSKCWKPRGSIFSLVGVLPREQVSVVANGDKLSIVDKDAAIQRHACKQCGVHLFGRIEVDHPFKGLDFVHVELSEDGGWHEPQFAAFASSVVEAGFVEAERMGDVRGKFEKEGLVSYDVLSPGLMDAIAAFTAKKNGKTASKL